MESEGVVPLNNSVFDPKMANHTIDIYFFSLSPPSRATLMLIRALGLKHNVKIVDITQKEQFKPEFLKINPMHTVPTMDDHGFILWESHVIMKYLSNQYAKDDSLYPQDAKKAAVVDQRLYFTAGTLFPRLGDFCGPVLFAGQQPQEDKREKVDEALKTLDMFLINQTWLAGQYLTIADFSVIAIVSTAEATGQFNIQKYDNLWAWYQRAQNAMAGFGYEDINQVGANAFGNAFKSRLNS
ncbi:glutathione S-transferase 1 [Aethina tumida]|uniref:glutathione S-transferase 1 n=1 Tax=Aethina tumida TaxID=116153 RepID=UPI0021480CBA|nr:glutathione S-transferase 1 [Aethina tumida]